jgi:membrane-bound lytic murein transglycosylase A
VLLGVLVLGTFGWWWLNRPVPTSSSISHPAPLLVLTAAKFSDLPGWRDANLDPALDAFRRSCTVIAKKPPTEIIANYAGTAADWQKVCVREAGDPRTFFEKNFTPYAFAGKGLFTGYYEPEIRGSRTRQGAYQTPVYGLPSDLIQVDLSPFAPEFKGEHISGRLSGQKLVPYADRAAINAKGVPTAKILFWCDDPVALFFLQIQGSGRVRFTDGRSARIAYAGGNGRPYTAIGRVLLAKGELEKEKISLATIRDWLRAHPELAKGVMEANQSFIFFEEKPLGDMSLGSNGVEGVPLTPLGSMAIDLRKNALGAPYYVAADAVKALLIAQDTGGAIRGQVRGDVYFGFGETAEQRAGDMKAQGRMFVLLPNDVAVRLGKSFSP